MSMSSVLSRFLEKVGVSNVAFSPLINLTSRNCRNSSLQWITGGQGKLGPNNGTVSSLHTDKRKPPDSSTLTTANTSVIFVKEINRKYLLVH